MANYTLLDYSLNTSFNIGSDIMPLVSISDGIDLTQSMCNTLKVTYPFKVYNSASYVGTSEGYVGTVFMSVFIFDSEPTIEATYSGTLEHIGNYYIYVTGVSTTAPTYTDYVTSPLELFLVQDTFNTYIGTHIVTGGGAGSGYIGNSLVSNKKMVGYNVPTSSAEGTKTESVNVFDSNPVANKPKAGNGFARIKFLHDYIPTFPITSYDKAILFPSDDMPVKLYLREDATVADVYSTFDQRSDTCFLIWDMNTSTYLIYRFRAAEQGGTPFRVVSYQYMEQEGTANEIWGMNAETHELYPTDGYGRNLGRIWLPSIVKDGARYDGAGAYGGVSSEHPTIYCSKLSADVYIDGVLIGHYNHD